MFNQNINRKVIDEFERKGGKNPEQAVFMSQHDQIDIFMLNNGLNVPETMDADDGPNADINTAGLNQAAQHSLCINNFTGLTVFG